MTKLFLNNLLNITFNAFYLLILARIILSWFPNVSKNKIGRFITEITEPILKPIRNILPKMGMVDFSPIVAFLILEILQGFLKKYLG